MLKAGALRCYPFLTPLIMAQGLGPLAEPSAQGLARFRATMKQIPLLGAVLPE